ncbi:PDZ domain (Also known as DHR or GLGF) [compost metagenome]
MREKYPYLTILFTLLASIGSYAQNDDSHKTFEAVISEYHLPLDRNGLSVSAFFVTPSIRIVRWEKSAEIFLSIKSSQGTSSNPNPSFTHSYNYMGKKYGNETVGYDAFRSIQASDLTYEVTVTYGSKAWTRRVKGTETSYGPIDKNAGAEEVFVRAKVVAIFDFSGTSVIEAKLRGILKPQVVGTSSGNGNPLSSTGSRVGSQATVVNGGQGNAQNSNQEAAGATGAPAEKFTANDPLAHFNTTEKSAFQEGYEKGQAIMTIATGLIDAFKPDREREERLKAEHSDLQRRKRDIESAFNSQEVKVNRILKTWKGARENYSAIPGVLEGPAPSWEQILGTADYNTAFGKDAMYITKNFRTSGGRNKQILMNLEGAKITTESPIQGMTPFYAADVGLYVEYPLNTLFAPAKTWHHMDFMLDENNIVIGIAIDPRNFWIEAKSYIPIESYMENILKKIKGKFICLNANTYLLKDKLIRIEFRKITMYDLNYLYDRVLLDWADEYYLIEKLSAGAYKFPRLGVNFVFEQGTAKVKDAIKLATSDKGIIVGEVISNGPAEKAGIKPGDIITAVRGIPVRMTYMLQLIIVGYGAEGRFDVSYLREGKEYNTVVAL